MQCSVTTHVQLLPGSLAKSNMLQEMGLGLGAHIHNALVDGFVDSIKDELVVDVLLITQGRASSSQVQIVIQLCIHSKHNQSLEHLKHDP